MKRPIDIDAQFKKLVPRAAQFAKNWGLRLSPDKMIKIVDYHIDVERNFGIGGYHAYNLNRHLALIELRDAIKLEISK